MFYHVLVEPRRKNNDAPYCEYDKANIDEVLGKVVYPYLRNEEFRINGYTLTKADVTRLLILESDKSQVDLVEEDVARTVSGEFPCFMTTEQLIEARSRDITDTAFATAKRGLDAVKVMSAADNSSVTKDDRIFIVHGRDVAAKSEVARFVESLDLRVVILHEQASSGKTLVEKIEEYTNVKFAIVLYTPCDVGGLASDTARRPRARQNVVFEHGYLFGKLGRHNVCALINADVEYPSDISGMVYITFGDQDAWKLKLAKELRKAGFEIDFNKII